jgi:hypothetical protein
MTETCETCRFWNHKYGFSVEDLHFAECRRFPPRPTGDLALNEGVWPGTCSVDWCGEYDSRLSVVDEINGIQVERKVSE